MLITLSDKLGDFGGGRKLTDMAVKVVGASEIYENYGYGDYWPYFQDFIKNAAENILKDLDINGLEQIPGVPDLHLVRFGDHANFAQKAGSGYYRHELFRSGKSKTD